MVYLFLANGFEEIEALTPVDMLRRAGVAVTTVGVGGPSVLGAHGIRVEADIPDIMFGDNAPEMVILPGGMPGAKHLDESRIVDTALRMAQKSGAYIAAICAAPMVPGHRDLLRGKKVTCFPGFEGELAGADVRPDRVVRDGNIITAAGMGVALEFSLALVAALCGEEKAEELRRAVLAD